MRHIMYMLQNENFNRENKKLNRNAHVFKRRLLWKTSLWIKTLEVKIQNLHFSMDMILKVSLINC